MNNASLLQPGWREGHRSVNNVNLHVVEAGPEDGPLLVLLHGFPEFWWGWRHQIGPFADAGYHVVVPDMRGYNTSEIPTDVSDYVLDKLTADVVALADSFGAARFDLVAHDWGAVISWWVVAHYPERIKHAVIMDGPHPDVWAGQALKHPTQALRSTYVAVYQLPWLPEAALGAWDFAALRKFMEVTGRKDTFEPGSLDRYVEAWSHPGSLTAMLNYYRALRERKAGKEPARLARPTLVLWAEKDSFLERSVAEAGVALCDQGRLEIVPGTTHWLHLEEPGRINATVLRFLADESRGACQ